MSSIKGLDKIKVECFVRFSLDILTVQMMNERKFKSPLQTACNRVFLGLALINIQEDEVESLPALLSAPQYNNGGLYLMSVGRFVAINQQPVLATSFDERLYEGALLRALGATRRQVLLGLMTEFTLLGLLAGLLAATAASGLGYVLAEQVFNLPYQLNGWLWVIGPLGGALGVGLAGVLGTRSLLQQPPLEILRRN